ncbi:hypothetical protein MMC26_004201 [Xylographa opegraphella]|nr:hypothetical protein [Xylographa opegraphella]
MPFRSPVLLLLSALDLAASTRPSTEIEIPADPLLNRFQSAMTFALEHMNLVDRAYPAWYDNGGGCYFGYGTSLSGAQCRAAVAQMPSQNPDVDDVTEGTNGPILTRNFYQTMPLIWRSNDCLIGVSVSDVRRAKGLYPLFKEAAQLILDTCVTRARGGLVRFGHFEVILFDAKLLPGYEEQATRNFIYDFAMQEANIPFSTGLLRMDPRREAMELGFEVGNI